MKQFAAALASVQQSLNAAAGTILVLRGITLQGDPNTAPAGVDGRNKIPGYRMTPSGALTVSTQVRRTGVREDGSIKSMSYPVISFAPAAAHAAQELARAWATIDAVASFETTWDKGTLWLPMSDERVLKGRYTQAKDAAGNALAPMLCMPIEHTVTGYSAKVLDFAPVAAADAAAPVAPESNPF
jgi:hypothetical protein